MSIPSWHCRECRKFLCDDDLIESINGETLCPQCVQSVDKMHAWDCATWLAMSNGAVYFDAEGNFTEDRKLAICGMELGNDGRWYSIKEAS